MGRALDTGDNLSVPSGHLPFQGRLLGLARNAAWLRSCCMMQFSVQVTFAAHANPKRQGVPAAVYGQPPECHGAEPKETPVVSPWEGSDPGDGWERPWGPGASLSYMKIWAGPEWLCPSAKWGVRPQTDEMLSS